MPSLPVSYNEWLIVAAAVWFAPIPLRGLWGLAAYLTRRAFRCRCPFCAAPRLKVRKVVRW